MLGRAIIFSSCMILLSLTLVNPEAAIGVAEITGVSASVELDKNTYPIPYETPLNIQIRIFDPDFNTSPTGIDQIAKDLNGEPGVGPVKISIIRSESVVLGYAGGKSSNSGKVDSEPLANSPLEKSQIKQYGPITEISPSSGIFEFSISIKSIDGPASSKCSVSSETQLRFDDPDPSSKHCILQGDVILVEYTDPSDVSGNSKKVTTSSTFSQLNANPLISSNSEKITASKTVRIGHPLTLLLYDSNLNLDSNKAESYSLDLIQFESKNIRTTLGPSGGVQKEFDPQPSSLRETGDNTGIFYSVIKVPRTVDGKRIDVDEKIEFEYAQQGLGAYLVVVQEPFSPSIVNVPKNSVNVPNETEKSQINYFVDIVCKDNHVKIFKYDGTPACVKPSTAEKLSERGWSKN